MADRKDGSYWDGERWVPTSKGGAHDAGGDLATADAQEKARKKITAKDSDASRPVPPDTTGMGLVAAAAANAAYKKKMAAWEAARTAGNQAKAVEK